jgi:hypothetical protein
MRNGVMGSPRVTALVVSVVAALTCCGGATASVVASGATKGAKVKAKKKPAKKAKSTWIGSGPLHGVVPAEQVAIFASLSEPRATTVPTVIVRQFTAGLQYLRQLGIDYTEARRLDVAGARMYLIPGKGGICLFGSDGVSRCSEHLDQVARYGLSLDMVPPPAGPVDVNAAPVSPGPVFTFGVVPRGYTTVTVTSTTGTTIIADQSGEAYVALVRAPGIVSRTRTGPGLEPVTDPVFTP